MFGSAVLGSLPHPSILGLYSAPLSLQAHSGRLRSVSPRASMPQPARKHARLRFLAWLFCIVTPAGAHGPPPGDHVRALATPTPPRPAMQRGTPGSLISSVDEREDGLSISPLDHPLLRKRTLEAAMTSLRQKVTLHTQQERDADQVLQDREHHWTQDRILEQDRIRGARGHSARKAAQRAANKNQLERQREAKELRQQRAEETRIRQSCYDLRQPCRYDTDSC